MTDETLMPQALYSAEGEKAILGAMMAQPGEVMEEATEALSKADFFVPAHQEIFVCLLDLWNKKQAIEVVTIHQWLADRKLAESLGSPGILAEILVGFASHLNVGSYIRIVKDKSLLRSLQASCAKIVQDIADMPDSVASVLDRAEKAIFEVTRSIENSDSWNAVACCNDFRAFLDSVQDGTCETRLRTGIQAIDKVNGGFPKPGFVVIAGPQGGGKSAMMLSLMENWCKEGLGVGLFSIEMTRRAIMQRKVASVARIDSRLMNRPMAAEPYEYAQKAIDSIEQWKFEINPKSRMTLADLRSQCRRWKRDGIDIAELDYIQLVASSAREDRRIQLVEISNGISAISKELDMTFVCLAQINRDGAKAGNYKTSDLADCKAIGDAARVVIMLEEDPKFTGPLEAVPFILRVDKYSEGETHQESVTFNKREQRIT